MQPDPPPADFLVTRTGPDMAIIAACRAHLSHTKAVLQAGDPAALIQVSPANVDIDGNRRTIAVHGCKGHMEDWPVTVS